MPCITSAAPRGFSMSRLLVATLVLPLLAGSALAQAPAAPGGRTVTSTGVTKPPGRAGAPYSRVNTPSLPAGMSVIGRICQPQV